MTTCDYCHGPASGRGLTGRPWPGRPAAGYCCYGCLSLGEQRQAAADAPRGKIGGVGVRLGVGLLVVGQSMIFGLALNIHDDVPASVHWLVQTLILCGILLVGVLLGGPLVRAAAAELRRGRLTIEALFLLTMAGALAASLRAYLTGRGPIYFEVVSVLLVVYTLGKVIGARGRAAALANSRAWAQQLDTARVVTGGEARAVPVAVVRPGDVVEVHPGETIAVDGVIREGVGFVSEAAVSGEPFPIVRRPGDRVMAGAASHDATFRLEATVAGTARQIDRLIAAVEDARNRPLALQSQADRLGRVFFPLVVLTAAGTFLYWTLTAGWEAGLLNAMSVLLVACPCVIGLATPVVVWAAVGRLAERGLIVRTGDAVERLAGVDRVLFDKTGTLTEDRFALVDVVTAATGEERAKVLGWLSLIEAQSAHPVARAFAELPRSGEAQVRELRAVPGCGLEAVIEEASGARHNIRVGRPDWASGGREPPVSPRLGSPRAPTGGSRPPLAGELRAAGHRIDAAIDGTLAAAAVVAERVRDSVPEMLAGFRRLGLPVEVLTGDTAERAAALDLPTRAGLLPDDKRAAVAAGGKPLFVGDGINDAAALAAAHAGVALSSGTDLAVGAADATLYHGDLRVLPWAVSLSQAAVRAVRRNLYRAAFYNLVGMALAAGGVLHPVAAAVLMMVSSLTLLYSSTRVGAAADHCDDPASGGGKPPDVDRIRGLTPPARRAAVHALALALQGVVFAQLLGSGAPLVVAGYAASGVLLALVWHRWAALPHAADMAFGMLTLGNLGMLLGWWLDLGCEPVRCAACCACDPLAKPGMWLGMLLAANAAMLWLGRRPLPCGPHRTAMFTGGNVGMLLGMGAGGSAAGGGFTAHFFGMTVGMAVGMLLGTRLTEWLLTTRLRFPRLVRQPVERRMK
jgi:heavy metal translocating P-type ATPase